MAGYQTDESFISTVYMLHKLPSVPREPTLINVDDIEQFEWIEPLQKTIEERVGGDDTRTVWLMNEKVGEEQPTV